MESHFLDVQKQSGDQFSSQFFGCAYDEEGRSDSCWIEASKTDGLQRFRCDCSGTEVTGEMEGHLDESAPSLRAMCSSEIDSCKKYDPKDRGFPEGWPDDRDEDKPEDQDKPADPNQDPGGDGQGDQGGTCPGTGGSQGGGDPGADFKDAVKRLGCRAALGDREGLPAVFGLGALLLLGRLRRRR